jgi:GT2 family glycosyltransferase
MKLYRSLTPNLSAGTSLLDDTSWFTSGWPVIHGLVVHRVRQRSRFGFECFAPVTQNTRVQAIDGVFMAATRRVCQAIPFDQVTFDGFHFYDLDFSYRAYRAGFKLGIARHILIIHESMGAHDAVWAHYSQRFVRKFQDVIDFGRRSRDFRFGLATFNHEAEVIEFHRRLLPALNELAYA